MTVEETFFTTVTGDAGVSALMSARLYPRALPGNPTLPAAAYMVVSRVQERGLCYQTRIRVYLYATTYSGVKALRDAWQTLADATSNWEWREGIDGWAESGTGFYFQEVDILIHGT